MFFPRNLSRRGPFRLPVAAFAALVVTTPAFAGHSPRTITRQSLERVLERARAAVQGNLTAPAVRFTGTAKRNGADATYLLVASPDGRYRQHATGDLSSAAGFDGSAPWSTDWSGVTRMLYLGDDEKIELPVAVMSGTWLAPGGRFRVALAEEKAENGTAVVTVQRLEGRIKARVGLSTADWLPRWMEYRSESMTERWEYSDFRHVDGIAFAGKALDRHGDTEDTYTLDRAEALPSTPKGLYSEPKSTHEDTTFDADVPAIVESRRTPTGHVFVHPKLNGKDVGWFFLDCGAGSMCITPEAAEAAGMKAVGEVLALGVGGAVKSKLRRGGTLQVGPVSVRDLVYIELDLSPFERAFGFKVSGICGYDLLARTVLEYRAKDGQIAIHDPDRYALREGKWQELLLCGKVPVARCSFPGVRDEPFRLDTGSGATVDFHAPAVKKWNLLEGRETVESSNGGVGGRSATKAGTIDWFEIGGHRFEKPRVGFSLAEKGAFANDQTAGNIGQKFMEPFTLVFDYPHRRMAFLPTSP